MFRSFPISSMISNEFYGFQRFPTSSMGCKVFFKRGGGVGRRGGVRCGRRERREGDESEKVINGSKISVQSIDKFLSIDRQMDINQENPRTLLQMFQ